MREQGERVAREIVESGGRALFVATDRKGIVVYYNDGATRSLGYSPDEVLGSFVGRLYPSVDEAKHVMEAMREQEGDATGMGPSVQTVFVAKDGTEKLPRFDRTLEGWEKYGPDGSRAALPETGIWTVGMTTDDMHLSLSEGVACSLAIDWGPSDFGWTRP